jgi:hypothetical protein
MKSALVLRSLAILTVPGSVNMMFKVRKCDYFFKKFRRIRRMDGCAEQIVRISQKLWQFVQTQQQVLQSCAARAWMTTMRVAVTMTMTAPGQAPSRSADEEGRGANARYQACAPWRGLALPRRRRTATSKPPTVANMASMPGSGTSSASSCAAAKPCRASAVASLMPRSRAT